MSDHNLSRVDYENRLLTQDAVRNALVLGYGCFGSYTTRVHGGVETASGRVRIVIDCSHNPTYNTVSSYAGAFKLKLGFDVSQNCVYTLYEGAHIPAFTANKVDTHNFNRIIGDAACTDVSVNVLGQFAVATETSGNVISTSFIHAPSASGVGGTKTESIGNQGSEYSVILHPLKKYLIDIQNTTGSTSVTNFNFRLVQEPNIPTS